MTFVDYSDNQLDTLETAVALIIFGATTGTLPEDIGQAFNQASARGYETFLSITTGNNLGRTPDNPFSGGSASPDRGGLADPELETAVNANNLEEEIGNSGARAALIDRVFHEFFHSVIVGHYPPRTIQDNLTEIFPDSRYLSYDATYDLSYRLTEWMMDMASNGEFVVNGKTYDPAELGLTQGAMNEYYGPLFRSAGEVHENDRRNFLNSELDAIWRNMEAGTPDPRLNDLDSLTLRALEDQNFLELRDMPEGLSAEEQRTWGDRPEHYEFEDGASLIDGDGDGDKRFTGLTFGGKPPTLVGKGFSRFARAASLYPRKK